jgi:hypothetical protein
VPGAVVETVSAMPDSPLIWKAKVPTPPLEVLTMRTFGSMCTEISLLAESHTVCAAV